MTARRTGTRVVLALGVAALTALAAPDAQSSPGAKRVRSAQASLSFTGGGRVRRAGGVIVMKVDERRGRREIMMIRLRGLQPRRSYSIFCDDPSTADRTPEPIAVVKANSFGRATLVYDSRRGDRFPCEATINQLAGARFELRDMRSLLVLAGAAPDPEGVVALDAAGCRFLETTAFEDNFDAGTVGSAPTDWTVTGASVTVDDLVKDGATGASALIADVDPLVEAPTMTRTFGAESGFFAVEFTMISSAATDGRVVFQLGDDSGGSAVFATGLGSGLGFYEDGTIGFGIGDPIVSYAASTSYHFRIDVDMAAKTFDVAIDGTNVVAGRGLGFTGTSLDVLSFGGTATTIGTANVDTVKVIHKTQDCPPVANAGVDQTLEATAPATPVTLDGSASADPEGAPLTYTWTGDFVEGTATGATPTVHFALGSHVVTLVVNDGFFDSAPDTTTILVQDTTPPELTVTGLPTSIWPPNHQLIRVQPTIHVSDLADPNPTVALAITSSESDNGHGDGNTTGDYVITSAGDFQLRGERSGPGSGRTYHLVWTATDASGNSSTFSSDVSVPHDNGHGNGNGH